MKTVTKPKIKATKILNFELRDIGFLSLCFGLILLCSIVLYNRLDVRIAGSGQEVGVLIVKKNIALRKQNKQVFWESVENIYPLYSLDTIRTGESSSALIKLKDGTQLDLAENTLIIIDFSSKEKGGKVNVGQGSLRARRTELFKPDANRDGAIVAGAVSSQRDGALVPQLKIETGGQTITVGNADVLLEKKKNQKTVNLTVNQGELTVASPSGPAKTLGANQKLRIDKSGKLDIKELQYVLKKPADGQRLIVNKQKSVVTFSWRKVQKKSTPNSVLQVSKNVDFSRIAFQASIRGRSITTRLPSDTYYWRITNKARRGIDYSSTYNFSMLISTAVRLESPANGQIFSYFKSKPLINFSWEDNQLASAYDIEVSKDRKFKNIIAKKIVQGSAYSFALDEGSYYWRVGIRSVIQDAKKVSKSRIVKIKKLEPKNIAIHLIDGQKGNIWNGLLKNGIPFAWVDDPEFEKMQIEIADSPNFKKILLQEETTSNYYILRKNIKPGKYYWRVLGKIPQIAPSKLGSFTITDTFKTSFKLLQPDNGTFLYAKGIKEKGLVFAWESPQISHSFQLQISRSPNFRRIIKEKKVNVYSAKITSLPVGKYYWRVRLIKKDSDLVLSKSSVLNFNVRKLEVFVLKNGSTIKGIAIGVEGGKLLIKMGDRVRKVNVNDLMNYSF